MNEINKSVLVIDTPRSCITCPLAHYNEYYDWYECRADDNCWRRIVNWEYQKQTYAAERPDNCPLSPLPSQINSQSYLNDMIININNVFSYQYSKGWNAYREELLKENPNE